MCKKSNVDGRLELSKSFLNRLKKCLTYLLASTLIRSEQGVFEITSRSYFGLLRYEG